MKTITSLFVASLLAACAVAPTASNQAAALLQADRDWAAMAVDGGDVEKLISVWTDDAIVYPPGQPPVRGKAAIRAFVKASLAIPGFQITWVPREAAVSADATLGYTLGENTMTVPGPNGKMVTLRGDYTTVWRREGGVWRCVIDMSSVKP